MSPARDLDIVVYGVTGFVGRLVADHLARSAPDGIKVGLAGRSEEKLRKVRAELDPKAAEWPLLTADSTDDASLKALAESAQVVVTTVGPYRKGGLKLVDACIAAGSDYIDLTGEVLFARESAERHDAAAKSGARIVHSTGFDSIPSDLGVLALHERAKADGAGDLGDTTLVVRAVRGGVSGGTVGSLTGQVDEMKQDAATRKIVADPYALSPDRAKEPEGEFGDMRGITRDDDIGTWLAPFVMAGYNTRIVRRSNALQDWAYGRSFRYRETTGVGTGPLAPVKGAALTGGLGLLMGGLGFGPTRKLLDRVLPDPGQGPSEKTQRNGFYKLDIHTTTSNGTRYVAHVSQQGDPGYAATAVMMGESALCLVLDKDRLPGGGGVLTPATGMGVPLIERLRKAGMTIDVEKR